MKKTIIALMALAGVASADITDGLQWAESFGDGYSQAATFGYNNAFYAENGHMVGLQRIPVSALSTSATAKVNLTETADFVWRGCKDSERCNTGGCRCCFKCFAVSCIIFGTTN